MKIKTFVHIAQSLLNESEMENIKKNVTTSLSNYFSNPDKYVVKDNSDNHSFRIEVSGFHDCEMRDANKNTYRPQCIRVWVFKSKGYDKAVEGDLDWKEKYKVECNIESLTCVVKLVGHYRKYRSKYMYQYEDILSEYTYGTEVDDLDIEGGMRKIGNYLYHSTVK